MWGAGSAPLRTLLKDLDLILAEEFNPSICIAMRQVQAKITIDRLHVVSGHVVDDGALKSLMIGADEFQCRFGADKHISSLTTVFRYRECVIAWRGAIRTTKSSHFGEIELF